jgi:hypothetical protein
MLKRFARAIVLVLLPALAGCERNFAPTRSDPTPFAAADNDCWEYSGSVAPDDTQPAMYAKCMARHGWVSCDARRRCEPGVW